MQLESHSYDDSSDFQSLDTVHRQDPLYPPCSHCPQGSMNQCKEAACPILQITSQCTNQCVVVACNDPTHPEPTCHVTGVDTICDSMCLADDDCVDCPGLEELLQCCTDYHSYFSHSKSLDQIIPQSNWNTSSTGDFCACDESDYYAQHGSQFFPQYSDIPPERPLSSISSTSSSPALSQAVAQFPQVNLPHHLSQSSQLMYNCMWANCKNAFPSLAELVRHVNLDHLRFANLTTGPASHQVCSGIPRNQQFNLNDLSCHWGDCAMYTCPESIPSSSTTTFPDTVLDVLTTHLLQDHLGIDYPFSQLTTVRTVPPPKTPPICIEVIARSLPKDLPDSLNDSSTDTPSNPLLQDNSHSSGPPPTDYDVKPCKWIGCRQTFNFFDDLTTHILSAHIGSGRAHYECFWEGCTRHGEQGFSSKQKVARHMQSHTGHRPFQCNVCGLHFSETATLQQHMRRHTQEKPYVCDFPACGKAFAITGALTIHKRMHNGVKPFKCKYCEKAFAESSNLSKHLRTHTGVRPYPCPENGCAKSFARPDQLTRHIGVHRKKVVSLL